MVLPCNRSTNYICFLFSLGISERQSQAWQEICDQPVLPSVTSSLINYSKKSLGPALSRSSLGIAIKSEICGESSTSESPSKENNSASPRPSSSIETYELPAEKKVALVSYDCESSSGEEKE